MALINRFSGILQGALVLTGNALQIRQGTNFPPASNDFTNGSYITIDDTLVATAGFPGGTTFLASQCSASAILNIPSGSSVVFANLFWVSRDASNVNAQITFRTPLGDNTISPITALNQTIATAAWCTQDVKNIVNSAKNGTYTVLTNPGPTIVNGSSVNGAAWFLIVVYRDTSMPYRYFSVNTGFSSVSSGAPSDFTFSNIITPSSGTVNGYLLVTETFGDLIDGAQIFVGTNLASSVKVGNPSTGSWNGVAPFAQIDTMLPGNILIGDCNDPNIGLLDTRGTFGTYNKNPFANTAPAFARNITDILGLDISNNLTNNQSSLFTRITYSGSGSGIVSSQSVQVDVNSATIALNKTVDKAIAGVGETLTYTVAISNTGLSDANSVVFIDTVPSGTSFIPGTFTVGGITIPSATIAPPGVNLTTLPTNALITVTFQVKVGTTFPSPNPLPNTAETTFNFIPGTGLAPVFSDAQSNVALTTIVSAVLSSSKIATPQVGIFDTITYTIPITNSGNSTATNVILIDTLPNTVSFNAGTITQDGALVSGDPNPPGVTLNNIFPGTTSTVSFTVTVLTIPSPNTIPNTATSTYDYEVTGGSIPNGSGATSTSVANTTVNYAALTTTKYVNKIYANIGDTLNYTIVLKNTGVVTAINVVFVDTIPTDTTLSAPTFKQDGIVVTGSPNPPGATLPNNIPPNASTTITFSVTVNTIPNPNPIPNIASSSFNYIGNPEVPTVKTGGSNGNIVSTQVNHASLSNIQKSVNKNFATCNDILIYTITVPNSGNTTAFGVVISDTVPSGTVFVPGTVNIDGGSTSFTPASMFVGTIPGPGQSVITFNVRVVC